MLQLWQWRNPRRHWLLKAPSHLNYLPVLFKVFPDAQVVFTHRDPLKAASKRRPFARSPNAPAPPAVWWSIIFVTRRR